MPSIPRNTKISPPEIVKNIEATRDLTNIKELFKTKPQSASLQLIGIINKFRDENSQNLESLKVRVEEINQQLANVKAKVDRLKKLSFSSSSYGTRLNEISYMMQEICNMLDELDEASKETFGYFDDNSTLIKHDASALETIARIKKEMAGFGQKKRVFERFIAETTRQLAVLSAGRVEMDSTQLVDWDEDPTCYQNTSIGLGHILTIKQTWKNDGYSIGDVEGSVVLQPMQIKQVASVDWTRRDYASRSEGGEQGEALSNNVTRESDVQEIIQTALSEALSGNSNVVSKSRGASAGASFAGPIGGGILGISGGVQTSKQETNSSSKQNGSRGLASSALQGLRDKIQQSASSLRSQRNTVIQTVSQEESVTATTEIIANYNRRHALTTMWFSINRHYVVEQDIVDVQECLFFPLPMTPFNISKIYRWRDILQYNLLDKQHIPAFDAVERIVDEYTNINFPENRYCDEEIEFIEGEMQISFEIPRIPDPDETALQAAMDEKNSEKINMALEENYKWIDTYYGRFFFLLKRKYNTAREAYLTKLKNEEKSRRDYIYEKEIVPVMVDTLVNEHMVFTSGSAILKADFTLVDKYDSKVILNSTITGSKVGFSSPKGRPLRVKFRIPNVGLSREEINELRLGLTGVDGIQLPDGVRIIAHSASIYYTTAFGKYRLYTNPRLFDDLDGAPNYDDVIMDTSRKTFLELQNPRNEDKMKAARLISHLNQHIEKYHGLIWMSMDTNRLFSLMDGYIAPNSGGRSVASVVESQPLGVVSNNIILKVVPGANLDPYYQINLEEGITLLDLYKPERPSEPFRITVKNPGLYGESVLGKCESAETIDDSKLWRYEDLKIPYLPTEIQPVSLDSRYQDPGNLQTKDYAQPMINMQTLTPDTLKESALKDAINLMGKSDIFRDATGLQGSQDLVKNAQNQNTQILKNATDAANTAMQMGASYAIEKQKQDIEAYKELSKNATPEERKELRKTMMESWGSNNKALEKALNDSSEIAKSQARGASQASATDTLAKVKDFVGAGTTVDKIKVNPDGSLEAEGLTTNNEEVKNWVTNNAATLLEIARDFDLKQAGKSDKSNVCWAYALALTLFPAYEWNSEKGNEAIIEEMLGLIDKNVPSIDGPPEVDLDPDNNVPEA